MYAYVGKIYRDYLAELVPAGVRVASKVPATRPARLVTITTAPAGSSPKPRILSWRRLILQCWAGNEIAAAELCELVRDLVVESRYARLGVRQVRVIGEPGQFNDPADDSPRFQTTIDVLIRAKR